MDVMSEVLYLIDHTCKKMYNFLTFKTFITPIVLIYFYYIGAVIMPFVIYYYKRKIFKKLGVIISLNWKIKLLLIAVFLFAELIWRMGFEALIGYFQIHNAILHSAH